jgi:asparagine synthetase B (glutamine-hydrolysing)
VNLVVSFPKGQTSPDLSPQPHREQGCTLVVDSRSSIDAPEILAAYHKWDIQCARTLSGDYAFALWDEQRQRLLAARSITGRCPFYFAQRSGSLFCASEPPFLLNKGISAEWDARWVAFWLLRSEDYWQCSPWQAIRPLLPGHTLLYEQRSRQTCTYASWVPPVRLRVHELPFEKAVQCFRTLLFRAITRRLEQQGISFDCSGGLDSSSVVASVAYLQEQGKINVGKIHIFHGYSDRFSEEDARSYLTALLKRYPMLEPHFINYDEMSMKPLEVVPVSYPSLQAVLMPALFQERARLLQSLGSTAHLMGEYGDHLFAPTIRCLWQQRLWRLLQDLWEWRHVRQPLALLYRAFLAKSAARKQRVIPSWIAPEATELIQQGLLEQEHLLRTWLPDPFQRALISGIIRDQILLPTNECGSVCSFPYLDQELIEFFCQCPVLWLMAPGQSASKSLLREAMRGILPESLRQRADKGNATRVVSAWSRQHSSEIHALASRLTAPLFVDHRGLISAIGRMRYGDCRDQRFVFPALALALFRKGGE